MIRTPRLVTENRILGALLGMNALANSISRLSPRAKIAGIAGLIAWEIRWSFSPRLGLAVYLARNQGAVGILLLLKVNENTVGPAWLESYPPLLAQPWSTVLNTNSAW